MSKYVNLIKADLKCVGIFANGTDEFDLNIAAYHCQQAVEKTCGYVAQIHGLKSKRTHNIQVWVEYLQDNGIAVPGVITNNAEKITSWESSSRYNINFVASSIDIERIKEDVEKWLSSIDTGKNVILKIK